jgi:prevent-host-death family protein
MREVGVLEAKTGFSGLVAEIERTGEEVIVTRHGRPVVRISAVSEQRLSRAERAALVRQILAERREQPDAEPFDIRQALDRDRGEEWS